MASLGVQAASTVEGRVDLELLEDGGAGGGVGDVGVAAAVPLLAVLVRAC